MCHLKSRFPLLALLVALLLFGFLFASYNIAPFSLQPSDTSTTYEPSENILVVPNGYESLKSTNRKFHVALTATAVPYSQWQSLVAYYSYKKFKDMPRSDMGDFTRILHSGEADSLMDEIPTFIVHKLPDGRDRGYGPLNRPWAFAQWLELASIEEEYVMMMEPDHIFVKPMPNLAFGDIPIGYKFFYITPVEKASLLRKFYPEEEGPITNIDPIGNSPAIMKKGLLKKLTTTWVSLSTKMKDDPECDKELEWVLEMYAYAVSAALHGIRHILFKDLMVQPPIDTKVGNAYIIHYTYGMDYSLKGKRLRPGIRGEWRFDKRSYLERAPPKNLSMPPDGVPETVVTVLAMINEASASIPAWDDLR